MANPLLKYKSKYRILPEIDQSTNDFIRDKDGSIVDYDIYISCQHGSKIKFHGHDSSGRIIFLAYIPSIGRGRNIKRAMDEKGIPYTNYLETDFEIEFNFKPKDIEEIAELMKAKTGGASISPFSTKNLPKADVEIPKEEIERYKAIIVNVQKEDLLIIHQTTTAFLTNILARNIKRTNRSFDVQADMRKLMMSRMVKEYIYVKNFWEEYLSYLAKKIKLYYNNK